MLEQIEPAEGDTQDAARRGRGAEPAGRAAGGGSGAQCQARDDRQHRPEQGGWCQQHDRGDEHHPGEQRRAEPDPAHHVGDRHRGHHPDPAEAERCGEEARRGDAVGEVPAQRVAQGIAGQHDADDSRPGFQGDADHRREQPAGGDLQQQDGEARPDHDGVGQERTPAQAGR